jgi:hypothetical protein
MKLNQEGYIDILKNDDGKIRKFSEYFLKKYKPSNPMEYALLKEQIIVDINFDFAMAEVKERSLKMWKKQNENNTHTNRTKI